FGTSSASTRSSSPSRASDGRGRFWVRSPNRRRPRARATSTVSARTRARSDSAVALTSARRSVRTDIEPIEVEPRHEETIPLGVVADVSGAVELLRDGPNRSVGHHAIDRFSLPARYEKGVAGTHEAIELRGWKLRDE